MKPVASCERSSASIRARTSGWPAQATVRKAARSAAGSAAAAAKMSSWLLMGVRRVCKPACRYSMCHSRDIRIMNPAIPSTATAERIPGSLTDGIRHPGPKHHGCPRGPASLSRSGSTNPRFCCVSNARDAAARFGCCCNSRSHFPSTEPQFNCSGSSGLINDGCPATSGSKMSRASRVLAAAVKANASPSLRSISRGASAAGRSPLSPED